MKELEKEGIKKVKLEREEEIRNEQRKGRKEGRNTLHSVLQIGSWCITLPNIPLDASFINIRSVIT
jgi:hypothetical protein